MIRIASVVKEVAKKEVAVLCRISRWDLEALLEGFALVGQKDSYFVCAKSRETGSWFRLLPDTYSGVVATFAGDNPGEFLQVGLSLNEVYELLYAKSGHYRDFEFAGLDDGNAVVATDSKHGIRVVIVGDLITDYPFKELAVAEAEKLTGFHFKQFEDGWGAHSWNFMEIYCDFYEIGSYKRESLPFAVRLDSKGNIYKILIKDGFKIFCVKAGYPALVNFELKRVSSAQAPCKHACVNDKVYSYQYFMKKFYRPWKKKQMRM